MASKRIGLYGGTFDPIHLGHTDLAQQVLSCFYLDEVWLIPSATPVHRDSPTATGIQRLTMCRLAIQDHPCLLPCDIEVLRPGKSYSIDTVRILKNQYTNYEFFFIMGVDAVLELMTWKSPIELISECKIVVIARPGFNKEQFTNYIYTTPMKNYFSNFNFLSLITLNISATDVRSRLLSGQDVAGFLDPLVADYIQQHGLYSL